MTERLDTDVAIVGGGIVGSSAALFLRRFGLRVVLLERGLCGAAASGVNYGGVRVQGRALSQLPLALRSRQLWQQLPELIGIDGEYVRSGHLKLARTDDDLARLEDYARRVDGQGLDLQLITGAAFRQRYPWLGRTAMGGSWCPGDGHANPRLVSPAFARAARAAGATVIEHCEVTELGHDGQGFVLGNGRGLHVRAPRLLNCAGAWALTVARAFGDDAPMESIHPGMAVTEPMPRFMDINIGVEGGGIYGRQTARGNCVMGGSRGAPGTPLHAKPRAQAIGELCQRMAELFPPLAHAQVLRFWSGVEGSLPDHQPVIGPGTRQPQLLHAFGFCGAGFQTGPAVGEALAQWVHHGRSDVPLQAFSIDRFTPHLTPHLTPNAAPAPHHDPISSH
ncbi:FAD-binding oxidoreductase [Ideonella sp. A 288]|uniref:NAD(P)/FAD-dependent oxidoreductase n=1 Tax=Ideonella sp. A 288 TaxID=1962181 RepID=UPI000B4BD54B|nr:FAD-binding oxidoreductase [Ideonella sp. A 288]